MDSDVHHALSARLFILTPTFILMDRLSPIATRSELITFDSSHCKKTSLQVWISYLLYFAAGVECLWVYPVQEVLFIDWNNTPVDDDLVKRKTSPFILKFPWVTVTILLKGQINYTPKTSNAHFSDLHLAYKIFKANLNGIFPHLCCNRCAKSRGIPEILIMMLSIKKENYNFLYHYNCEKNISLAPYVGSSKKVWYHGSIRYGKPCLHDSSPF